MKFFLALLPALAVITAAAPTAGSDVVAKREVTTIQNFMAELTSGVKQYTSQMNQIVADLPANPTLKQRKAAGASAIKQIKGLTTFIHEANTKIEAAEHSKSKRANPPTLGNLPHDVLGQLNGQPIVLAKLLLPVIQELNPALGSVLNTLSLTEVYVALQPLLTVELPALVTGLGNLVNGLLVALAPLLAGLGGILGPILLGLGL